jgi:hypothetical protein
MAKFDRLREIQLSERLLPGVIGYFVLNQIVLSYD